MKNTEAYYEGRSAFGAGLDWHDNPYDQDSPEYSDWNSGYSDAERDNLTGSTSD